MYISNVDGKVEIPKGLSGKKGMNLIHQRNMEGVNGTGKDMGAKRMDRNGMDGPAWKPPVVQYT